MLIEFSVANFLSLRDRQTFSLAKATGDELLNTNTFWAEAATRFYLLRSAAIYGPNAGGKSNFLIALRAMKEIVLESATVQKPGDDLPITPFLLDQATRHAPSEFEVTFIVNKIRYQYGFAATVGRIHEEWLFAYPKGRPQRWFERTWNEQSQNYNWELGHRLAGEKLVWQKSTRDNALYLSTAVQLNSEQLRPIYEWFKQTLRMTGIAGWNANFSASLCVEGKQRQIISFLREADLDIEDINVETKKIEPKMLPDNMPEHIKKELTGEEFYEVKTFHKDAEGELVAFDIGIESDGTQKLFSFSGPWTACLTNGHILIIDELNNSLHPNLVKFLVQLFHSNESNPKNAQLIFTTHETSILNQEIFRRDQVWFCEKSKDQATTIYPLTDFSPRKGRENLEVGYLSGRYGALPHIAPLRKFG